MKYSRVILPICLSAFAFLLSSAQNRMITRDQALADIDSLVYTISEVHPNMYASCKQIEFMESVLKAKRNLPDSLSVADFYGRIATSVAMIGDAHTRLWFPYQILKDSTLLWLPLSLDIDSNDSAMTVNGCVDGKIPIGAKLISLNGHGYKEMIENMLRYESGERAFYRLDRLKYDYPGLMKVLYQAPEYAIKYKYGGKIAETTLKAMTYPDAKSRMSKLITNNPKIPQGDYSFHILDGKSIAVMDFNSFINEERFKSFADSMFTILKDKRIKNLIIDIRNNGGGNSSVGDTLFQYISPVPYQQFGKALFRVSPTSIRLMRHAWSIIPEEQYSFYDDENLIPLHKNPLRYNGKVYLLISHTTFSSAGSFSWAFKYFKMGTVVGEESGGMNICFGEMLSYELPNSKLQCGISCKRFTQYGAKENDIHGTLPDYKVPQEKALDYTLKLIEKK